MSLQRNRKGWRGNKEESDMQVIIFRHGKVDYPNIYISSLQRSRETANQLFGVKDFIPTKLIDKVPLCASLSSNKKLPLIFWNVSGRLQWLFYAHAPKPNEEGCISNQPYTIQLLKW